MHLAAPQDQREANTADQAEPDRECGLPGLAVAAGIVIERSSRGDDFEAGFADQVGGLKDHLGGQCLQQELCPARIGGADADLDNETAQLDVDRIRQRLLVDGDAEGADGFAQDGALVGQLGELLGVRPRVRRDE